MIRRTFGSCKSALARVAGQTGMDVSDPRVMDYVNEATEELMNVFDFPWVIDRLNFFVTSGKITLPSGYDRIMLMNINCVPMQMQSPWFEFVGVGLDLITDVNGDWQNLDYLYQLNGVLDKDQVCQFQPIPTDQAYYLTIFGQAGHDERTDGVRAKIIVQGYDFQKQWIRTRNSDGDWIDGIEVEINGDTAPYRTDTTQTISEVTAISKEVTNGYVYLYVAPVSGTRLHIATYAPKDTQPFFRRYYIQGLNCNSEYHVLARCRKKFLPITEDGDFLIISNLPAMKTMVQAIYYRDANEPDDYVKYKALAVMILKDEARAYIGLQRTKPLITFAEGMGVRETGQLIL